MSPGESDFAMLEVARRCDFYGIKLHPAKDIEGTEARLAVLHLGIKVYHQLQCVSTFSWAKIRKLSFKRKKLLVKLHPDSYVSSFINYHIHCNNFFCVVVLLMFTRTGCVFFYSKAA
ncbi:FERM PH-like domain protein [Cooperia oncophora]